MIIALFLHLQSTCKSYSPYFTNILQIQPCPTESITASYACSLGRISTMVTSLVSFLPFQFSTQPPENSFQNIIRSSHPLLKALQWLPILLPLVYKILSDLIPGCFLDFICDLGLLSFSPFLIVLQMHQHSCCFPKDMPNAHLPCGFLTCCSWFLSETTCLTHFTELSVQSYLVREVFPDNLYHIPF